MWRPRNLTQAIRRSLLKGRMFHIGDSDFMLEVDILHHGRRLRPTAIFVAFVMVSEFEVKTVDLYQGADIDDLAIAEAIIGGHVPEMALLDWLQDRGVDMAEFLSGASDSEPSRGCVCTGCSPHELD